MARRNLILAFTLLAIGIILLVMIPFYTVGRAGRPGYLININPRTFPFMMAIIMSAMGLFNVVLAFRAYKKSLSASSSAKKLATEEVTAFDLKSVLPLFCIMFGYVFVLPSLGYVISTVILCTATGLFFKARAWEAILLGCLLALLVFLVFTRIGVPLPRGILTFL